MVTRKSKSLRNGTENSVCSLCIAQAKTINFDEPFSGFDPVNANTIKDETLREDGATIIFSTPTKA
jgi:ABC-2 type transport system ATP-binding protein